MRVYIISARKISGLPSFPCTFFIGGPPMYRTHKAKQLDLFTQIAPIMDVLDREDEIIKLADSIDWDYIEKIYSRNFTSTKKSGNPNNYPARVAFGALFLKQYSGLTDRQLVQQIKQNPYWQYFLGYEEYSPMNTSTPQQWLTSARDSLKTS